MTWDSTLPLAYDGYLHLSRLRRRAGRDTVTTRVLGRRAMVLVGPESAELFYDRSRFDRQGVLPPTVPQTLFGQGAVHLLDGSAHLHRKAMFVRLLGEGASAGLAAAVTDAWDERARTWTGRRVEVFTEAAEVLCVAVHRWADVPLAADEVPAVADDLVALVDGFGSVGPRYVRARLARRRQEHRVAGLVDRVRAGRAPARSGSALELVAHHRDEHGDLLPSRVAAVELLNLLRPTVAVAWFVTFAVHALVQRPRERSWLAASDELDRATAFAHEVRRFYPMAPLLAARALQDVEHDGVLLRRGDLALLDVFGHHHHPAVWRDPWEFVPARHLGRQPGPFDLLAQGGGDIATGHRCPGEPAVVDTLTSLVSRLAALDLEVPPQDLAVTRHRMPARVRSDMVVAVR